MGCPALLVFKKIFSASLRIQAGKGLPDIAGEIQRAQCAHRAFAAQFFRTRYTGLNAVQP